VADAGAAVDFVGVPVDGLVGNNILGKFDVVFDIPQGSVWLSVTRRLGVEGNAIPVSFAQGLPVVPVRIGSESERMIFDTASSFYYYQGDEVFPKQEPLTDFHPSCGWFTTDTLRIPLTLGSETTSVTCGRLPESIAFSCSATETVGILGNEFMVGTRVGYFPKRRQLVLGRQ
jgi:hypothetical protein